MLKPPVNGAKVIFGGIVQSGTKVLPSDEGCVILRKTKNVMRDA
jgi:hypothetical protein